MIINGSPRAPKSNSRQYAGIFARHSKEQTDYFSITKTNHHELCRKMEDYTDVLLVFPLYADSLPVTLLNFLKSLESNPPERKPVISVLVNCGFLEYSQNDTAVKMIKFFCKQNGYATGSVLMLGSGEAILATPFRYVAERAVRKLAKSVSEKKYRTLQATMPLTKALFRMAATVYWTNYGRKFGTTKKEMQTMRIE